MHVKSANILGKDYNIFLDEKSTSPANPVRRDDSRRLCTRQEDNGSDQRS